MSFVCSHIHSTYYTISLRQSNLNDDVNAEGSESKIVDQYSDDDPFVDDIPKNVMLTPLSKREKKYLEDFEIFTIE